MFGSASVPSDFSSRCCAGITGPGGWSACFGASFAPCPASLPSGVSPTRRRKTLESPWAPFPLLCCQPVQGARRGMPRCLRREGSVVGEGTTWSNRGSLWRVF
jgi:hypothetical protein